MLRVEGLGVAYGKHEALHDVTIHVDTGETVALLGANGAGKSSLLKAITGLVPGVSGTILHAGDDIARQKPHVIVERGIALVPEGRRLVGPLTVIENLMLGAYPRRARGTEASRLAYVLDIFPRLAERRSQVVRTMSGGEQQMVAIGRALMMNPDLLLLDEPSLGLSPRLTVELFDVLRRVASDTRMAIMLVEQNARQALALADRAYVLANGRIVGEGPAATLRRDPAVARSYLGL